MTGLIFHVDEWKGLCYDGPDALSILAPQMEQRWHFIMICRPPRLSRLHAGGSDGNGCVSSVEVKLMFPATALGKPADPREREKGVRRSRRRPSRVRFFGEASEKSLLLMLIQSFNQINASVTFSQCPRASTCSPQKRAGNQSKKKKA